MAKNKSDYTKLIQKKIWLLRIIDAIILVCPLAVFFVLGLMKQDALLVQKVTLVGTAAVSLILVIFNILAKAHLRSAIWIMVIGLYAVIDDLMPLILSIAIATVVDEFVITPLLKRYKTKFLASETMDERGIV